MRTRNINVVGKSVPRCNMHGDATRPCAVRWLVATSRVRREGSDGRPCNCIVSIASVGCVAAFTQLQLVDTAPGEVCNGNVHAVDSYCFVIGPVRDATRRVRSTEWMRRRILCEGSFYWKFSAAHFWISAIFPFARACRRVPVRRFTASAFSRCVLLRFFPLFCIFFFLFFLFFCEGHRVKFEASE